MLTIEFKCQLCGRMVTQSMDVYKKIDRVCDFCLPKVKKSTKVPQ